MKGIVFKMFESFVTDNFGEEAFFDILDSAELSTDGTYVGPGTYPDSDLVALAVTAANKLNIPVNDAIKAFGKYSFAKLVEAHKDWIAGYNNLRDLILKIDDTIHVEVRKLYEHSNPPKFVYKDVKEDSLTVEYHSARKLCVFMEGLLEGGAEYYKEKLDYNHAVCCHEGADHCEFELKFG